MVALKTYLKREGITGNDFGKKVRVSASTISRICSGKRLPSARLVRLIVMETAGAVTAVDLLNLNLVSTSRNNKSSRRAEENCGVDQ